MSDREYYSDEGSGDSSDDEADRAEFSDEEANRYDSNDEEARRYDSSDEEAVRDSDEDSCFESDEDDDEHERVHVPLSFLADKEYSSKQSIKDNLHLFRSYAGHNRKSCTLIGEVKF